MKRNINTNLSYISQPLNSNNNLSSTHQFNSFRQLQFRTVHSRHDSVTTQTRFGFKNHHMKNCDFSSLKFHSLIKRNYASKKMSKYEKKYREKKQQDEEEKEQQDEKILKEFFDSRLGKAYQVEMDNIEESEWDRFNLSDQETSGINVDRVRSEVDRKIRRLPERYAQLHRMLISGDEQQMAKADRYISQILRDEPEDIDPKNTDDGETEEQSSKNKESESMSEYENQLYDPKIQEEIKALRKVLDPILDIGHDYQFNYQDFNQSIANWKNSDALEQIEQYVDDENFMAQLGITPDVEQKLHSEIEESILRRVNSMSKESHHLSEMKNRDEKLNTMVENIQNDTKSSKSKNNSSQNVSGQTLKNNPDSLSGLLEEALSYSSSSKSSTKPSSNSNPENQNEFNTTDSSNMIENDSSNTTTETTETTTSGISSQNSEKKKKTKKKKTSKSKSKSKNQNISKNSSNDQDTETSDTTDPEADEEFEKNFFMYKNLIPENNEYSNAEIDRRQRFADQTVDMGQSFLDMLRGASPQKVHDDSSVDLWAHYIKKQFEQNPQIQAVWREEFDQDPDDFIQELAQNMQKASQFQKMNKQNENKNSVSDQSTSKKKQSKRKTKRTKK